ncbi:MAG: hypothetical protein JSW39_23730 [Desulfobacterales bacterium]|nr:MAG: hypothetical protein JSW39_23730 [Desulfobacterales bacterium]
MLLKIRVFDKINQLIATLRRVAQGEGNLRVRLKLPPAGMTRETLDEMECMAFDFNHMMDRLEETYTQLVKARQDTEAAKEELLSANETL